MPPIWVTFNPPCRLVMNGKPPAEKLWARGLFALQSDRVCPFHFSSPCHGFCDQRHGRHAAFTGSLRGPCSAVNRQRVISEEASRRKKAVDKPQQRCWRGARCVRHYCGGGGASGGGTLAIWPAPPRPALPERLAGGLLPGSHALPLLAGPVAGAAALRGHGAAHPAPLVCAVSCIREACSCLAALLLLAQGR